MNKRSIGQKSAYPIPPYFKNGENGQKIWRHGSSGITVRQYYKAAIISEIIKWYYEQELCVDEIGIATGKIADLLIEEDEKNLNNNDNNGENHGL